jgi:hypothetical protein
MISDMGAGGVADETQAEKKSKHFEQDRIFSLSGQVHLIRSNLLNVHILMQATPQNR